MMLRLGVVVDIHPEDNSVDLTMTDDGAHLAGVQVLTVTGGTRSGLVDLPRPAQPEDENAKWDITKRTESDVIAAVAYFDSMRMPVVVGFLYPQINQMLFEEKGRKIDRHESDVYSTTTKDGDHEWYHPSGTYVRVAVNPEHEDLTGKDFDKKWKIDRNTGKAVHVRLTVKNAGNQVASLNIDPEGNITVEHIGNLDIQTGGHATHTAQTITMNAETVTINADVAINGDSLTHNGVNVGDTHRHTGVDAGPDNTGEPVS
jgi:hypothetical protein